MLQQFLDTLCGELEIEVPTMDRDKYYLLRINGTDEVKLKDLNPGIWMEGEIGPCPEKRREELFLYLMRANYLGQGTGGSAIGLDSDEKCLTLSIGLAYELNYRSFKSYLEEFLNYLSYWREELSKFEREEKLI